MFQKFHDAGRSGGPSVQEFGGAALTGAIILQAQKSLFSSSLPCCRTGRAPTYGMLKYSLRRPEQRHARLLRTTYGGSVSPFSAYRSLPRDTASQAG
ncbi:Serine/threonine protein kinase PrkA [Granulibacter bethesdensis]|uniref:Serine/threonine protein kinase PrkA n=1 Tax=Granulibacter bethesdensis TaxID=364410 RepID=A0AAN0VF31_9PROT|nr:Serine/threonine protein kinase PrkA [Granulibacter bethesdensis]AHJ67532.1 Serine/threonine protein kinase PrkA [Granulibacter bethesdensis]APH58823.1 Serine/threonine protein kinase PrkA [Granulibacter bethesdensis]